MLLPPLLAVLAVLCMLVAIAISFGHDTKANPLAAPPTHDEIARQLTTDLEGKPSAADIRRAVKPLSERRRLLAKHPFYALYTIAKQHFDVSLYLVAAVHYQETGFKKAPAELAKQRRWKRHRNAIHSIDPEVRPTRYPHRTERHPSPTDDFDVVMAIARGLESNGANGLGPAARRAIGKRYGATPEGRLSAAMVLERARAWMLLGTLPMPGSGELATPVKGVVGGCGYFGCPRPGHLHNGVDFLAPTGVPIHAADGGVVVSVESPGQSGGYGNFVCIQHRPNLATCYAHLSAFAASVRPGARVWRGQVIGLVGSTGSSTAPHLHFEVRRGPASCSACAIDPLPLLSGEVPATVLPKMVATAPAGPRPLNVAAAPVAVAPAAPAPAPAASAPAPRGDSNPGDAATEDAVPDPPVDATTLPPARPKPASSQSGGTRPTEAPASKPAPPAASTAPAPVTQAPAAPAPAPAAPSPPADTGTGGATPDFSAPPAAAQHGG
ncbi:MAG: M23 family metallopeptidase [Solirubrobacteraceae bacterium]|nr:M23 family metallopeptidase [Solirubrobacteraceae bacterium]